MQLLLASIQKEVNMCDIFEYDDSIVKQRRNPVTKRYEETEKQHEDYYPSEQPIPHFFSRYVKHPLGSGIPRKES